MVPAHFTFWLRASLYHHFYVVVPDACCCVLAVQFLDSHVRGMVMFPACVPARVLSHLERRGIGSDDFDIRGRPDSSLPTQLALTILCMFALR